MTSNKGITLIALSIMVIILIIIASISTYSGIETIKSSKFNKFVQELEVMQSQVNLLYEKYYKNGQDETISVSSIGKNIPSDKTTLANETLDDCGVQENKKSEYKLFDEEIMKNLGVDGITGEYLVNIKERDIISLEAYEYDGKRYFRLDQINDKQQVDYELDRGIVNFDATATVVSKETRTWRIDISNIQFSKYVEKGKIQYREINSDKWKTIDADAREKDYNFIQSEQGIYEIKVSDAAGNSATKRVTIDPIYKVIIHYVDTNNQTLFPDYVGSYLKGETYNIASPEKDGYIPDTPSVANLEQGATKDVEITVTYSTTPTPPDPGDIIDEPEIPL